jgi:plastocyanin
MKNLKFFLVIFFIMLPVLNAYSVTWTVDANAMTFTPSTVNVTVGDTVKWQWISGTHTTTSTSVSAGALTWSAPLDIANTSFSYVVTQAGTYNYQCNFHAIFGMLGVIIANPIGIKPIGTVVPANYNLSQNFPNPFNPITNIKFDIPKSTIVKLVVYDMTGKQAALLFDGELSAGSYNVDWDASNFPSGVYFYRLSASDFSQAKKLVLAK